MQNKCWLQRQNMIGKDNTQVLQRHWKIGSIWSSRMMFIHAVMDNAAAVDKPITTVVDKTIATGVDNIAELLSTDDE